MGRSARAHEPRALVHACGQSRTICDAADRASRSGERDSASSMRMTDLREPGEEALTLHDLAGRDVVESSAMAGQQLDVGEDGDGLDHRVVVIRSDQHCSSLAVPRGLDPFVGAARLLDDLREVGLIRGDPDLERDRSCPTQGSDGVESRTQRISFDLEAVGPRRLAEVVRFHGDRHHRSNVCRSATAAASSQAFIHQT